jgi:hypothetical protein
MNPLFTLYILFLSLLGVYGENRIQSTSYNYTMDLLDIAFQAGDWKAGNNLGAQYYHSENPTDFIKATDFFKKSSILFLNDYDTNDDGTLQQEEYNQIPKEDRIKYPALFYNLGQIMIEEQEWEKAAKYLRISAESGMDSEVKHMARHDYAILIAKKKIKNPEELLKINDGIAFERKQSAFSFLKTRPEFNLSDSLNEISQSEFPQIAEVAKRNFKKYEMKELVRVNSAAIHQNKNIEIYSSSEKLANEFGRVDLASKGIIYIIDKQPKDANKIRNILKKFPDELNYSYYILYSIKALREDVNFRYRAKDFNEKVNFKKLDPDFQNKLDEYLPKTQTVATQKKFKEPAKAKVQRSIYDKSAHRSGGDRETKLLEFYNSYVKKAPPSNLDQCKSADIFIKKNKLIDDTGEAEFYLYLIWDAYHKNHGIFSKDPSISQNNVSEYLNDAHSKKYLDAIWHHYFTIELPEELLLNHIFQNIEHKEIDGSPKSIFNDILKAHYKITKNKLSSVEGKEDLLNFLQPYFDRKKDIEEAFVNSSFMNSEVREDIKKFQDFYKHNK